MNETNGNNITTNYVNNEHFLNDNEEIQLVKLRRSYWFLYNTKIRNFILNQRKIGTSMSKISTLLNNLGAEYKNNTQTLTRQLNQLQEKNKGLLKELDLEQHLKRKNMEKKEELEKLTLQIQTLKKEIEILKKNKKNLKYNVK